MRNTRWLFALPLVLGSLAVSGCADGPRIVKVSGTATRGGQPVPSLLLNFQPEKGRPSWAITDAQGRFTLEYDKDNKGAIVGTHVVAASYRAATADEEMSGKKDKIYYEIEKKYNDMQNSPMKIEITRAVDNLELKFD